MAKSLDAHKLVTLHANFDYHSTKRAFIQELDFVLLKFKLHNKVLLHKRDVEHIISEMRYNNQGSKFILDKKYYLAIDNGRNILCDITWSNLESHKIISLQEILSVDEMFDVIAELHACQPLISLDVFVNKLSNCNIPRCLIRLVWKACYCCINMRIWYKAIIEMSVIGIKSTDDEVCRILMYIDKNTNFILLRPLQMIQPGEVANELLSIFCDFGFPKDVDTNMRPFFKQVFELFEPLSHLFSPPHMYPTCREHKLTIMERKIRHMITELMGKSKSINWVIATHIVQWMLNSSPVLDTYIRSKIVRGPIENPYHGMFGILPNADLVQFNFDKSAPEGDDVAQVCSQCHQRVYKVYICHFCQSICHFMCCRRIVEETMEMPIIINKCISCDTDMSEEMILGA